MHGVLGFLRFLNVFCLDFLRLSGNGFTPKLWEILWEIPLNFRKCHCYLFCFLNGSRHLVGTDIKEILEIPCQCWLFQDSFPFLITRRSRGSNPVSATRTESSPNGLLFSFLKRYAHFLRDNGKIDFEQIPIV